MPRDWSALATVRRFIKAQIRAEETSCECDYGECGDWEGCWGHYERMVTQLILADRRRSARLAFEAGTRYADELEGIGMSPAHAGRRAAHWARVAVLQQDRPRRGKR